MKNIVVFTSGDSSNPSTWSNVPFLLTKSLEKKGYNIIRIDISTKNNIFTLAYTLFFKILKPKTTYYFVRSKINRKIVERKIKKAVNKYDDVTDFYISISYDFSPSKYTKKDVVLFHDWPIEYVISERFNRKPDFFEKIDIKRHKKVIESATYVISLFQDVANWMNKNFDKKVYYLGKYINGFYDIDGFDNFNERNKILFIGKRDYISSAKKVIKAFEKSELCKKNNIELHIIGMSTKDIKSSNKNIFFHGYLNKGIEEEKKLYYSLLKDSIVVINTSEKWGGLSSIFECMYYYKPIITSRYDEFVKTFGNNIEFGYYCNNDENEICEKIDKILSVSSDKYEEMCRESHDLVKGYTWDVYTTKLIDLIKNK